MIRSRPGACAARNVFAVALLAAMACDSRPTGGVVNGDAFLLMQSGDTKRASGVGLQLLHDPDSVLAVAAEDCRRYLALAQPLVDRAQTLSDAASRERSRDFGADVDGLIAALDRARADDRAAQRTIDSMETIRRTAAAHIRAAVLAATVDTARTSIDAHYRFGGIKPGRYAVHGEWNIGEYHYEWLAPAEVTGRDSVRRDLDNSVERGALLTCKSKTP